MGNYDYSTPVVPQMPQFRESDGRMDWRQFADMLIPGNVWNSRTNQYRPLGIAQGLTGIPVDTLYGAARGAGSFLGSIGRGNLFSRGPTIPRINVIGSNSPSWRNRLPSVNVVPRWNDAGASRPNVDGRVGNAEVERGGTSRAERGESPIGLGQLGRGGDEAMLYYSQAMRNRNGAQQER